MCMDKKLFDIFQLVDTKYVAKIRNLKCKKVIQFPF